MGQGSGQQASPGRTGDKKIRQSVQGDKNILHTLQVLHGSISETVLSHDGGSVLTLSASRGVLTTAQRVFHIGVGDENHQAWICQRDRGCLQGPESNHKEVHD